MIDPASMGDWAEASLLGVSFGGLATVGALALRKWQREDPREELIPVETRPREAARARMMAGAGTTRGA